MPLTILETQTYESIVVPRTEVPFGRGGENALGQSVGLGPLGDDFDVPIRVFRDGVLEGEIIWPGDADYAPFNDGGIPVGDGSTFWVPVFDTRTGEDGFLLPISVSGDGTPTPGQVIAPFADVFEVQDDQFAAFYTNLGNGSVLVKGFLFETATPDQETNFYGVIQPGPSGAEIVVLRTVVGEDGQALRVDVLPLPDGGYAVLEEKRDPFTLETVATTLTQYDAAGAVTQSGQIDPTGGAAGNASGLSLVLNGQGDLEVWATLSLDAGGSAVVAQVVDLLPETTTPGPFLPEEITATEGPDDLTLTEGPDNLDALGGDDSVFGKGGNDWIIGGDGDDVIDGGAGDDFLRFVQVDDAAAEVIPNGGLYGGAGDDTVHGRDGVDYIEGGEGADDLRGGAGDDAYINDAESDAGGLYGGAGDDFIRGNHGDDLMFGGDGADDMNGGFGDDIIIGDAGDDKLGGFDGSDVMIGGAGNDRMHGGRGHDFMDGGDGNDTLRGAEGDDELEGGAGDDVLVGGLGADRYVYVADGANGTDTIRGFTQGEDRIEVLSFGQQADALGFGDLFLSQEDSVAVIAFGDTVIRLEGVEAADLSEEDFSF